MNARKVVIKSFTAALLAAVALTGCQGIPQSGPVFVGLEDFEQAEQQVVYRPDMPVPDATQEDIVRGFLQAASSAADDYQIARQFLTSRYQNIWDPYSSVLIDEGLRSFSQTAPNQASFSLNAVAALDETGAMVQATPDNHTEIVFELAKENGQWRISSAPNGVILDRTTFRDIWSQQQLYFWGVSGTLVPDTRWFLNRGTVATQIVEQLINGPREVLNGALTNAFPTGTSLASDAVIIEAGVARIDVSREIFVATEEQLQRISTQLAVTLNTLPGINEFQLTVNNAEVLSGVTATDPTAQTISPADPTQWPAVFKDGIFGYLAPSGFIADEELSVQIASLDPQAIIARGGSRDAIIFGNKKIIWVANDEASVLDARSKLLEPTRDEFGFVWIMAANSADTITLIQPGVKQLELRVPWIKDATIEAFKVSPEGSKIAFLIKEEGRSKVLISGVVREADGTPAAVIDAGGPAAFWVTNTFLDLDWVDAQRVGVLSKVTSNSTKLSIGGLGVFPEERAAVQSAIGMHGALRASQLLLLSEEDELWTPQGSAGWQRQSTGISLLSKRG